jgi:IS4 transposase
VLSTTGRTQRTHARTHSAVEMSCHVMHGWWKEWKVRSQVTNHVTYTTATTFQPPALPPSPLRR